MDMTATQRYNEILSHFKVAKRGATTSKCYCPCHSDKTASLSVSMGERGILVHDFGGCATSDILRAVGLSQPQLFYDFGKPYHRGA